MTSTGNDREKFATYQRDGLTGLDYADQRYYASGYGRFNTVDSLAGSSNASDPASWNRYSYADGDPVNGYDPTGQSTVVVCSLNPNAVGCGNGLATWTVGPNPCQAEIDELGSGLLTCGSNAPVLTPVQPTQPQAPPPCTAANGLTADQTAAVETVMGENSYWLLGHQSYLPGNAYGSPTGPTITASMVYTEDVDMFSVFVNRTQSSQFSGTTIGAIASQPGQFLAYSNGTGLAKFSAAVGSSSGSSLCNDLTDVVAAMNFVLANGSQLASNYLYWKGIVQPGRHMHPARPGDIYVAGTVFETSN